MYRPFRTHPSQTPQPSRSPRLMCSTIRLLVNAFHSNRLIYPTHAFARCRFRVTLSRLGHLGHRTVDVICGFIDVFRSKMGFGSCYLMPFKTSIADGSAPVSPWPHRFNQTFTFPKPSLEAGPIQNSISPYSRPPVVISKLTGRIRIAFS